MRKITVLFISILSTFLFFQVHLLQAQTVTSSLTGTVTDVKTGKGIPGVNIVLSKYIDENELEQIQQYSTSDLLGTYIFKNILPGNYLIVVSAVGYHTYQGIVTVDSESASRFDIQLKTEIIHLGEVSVSSLKSDQLVRQTPLPVTVLRQDEIEKLPGITTSDLLANEPGLALTRDGIWATSLNIRGLSEQRIIMMIDGDRIETSSDLAAALSMFDVNDIDHIEVIKGAASSLYGSGALGGVLNVITKEARFSNQPYFQGLSSTTYESVNDLFGQSLLFKGGSQHWYAKLAGGLRNAGNTMTPDGELPNSQFHDRNISATLGIKPYENHELKITYQNFDANDVGIPGGSPFPKTAKATYLNASRRLMSAKYTINDLSPTLPKLSIKYYNQYIYRKVELIPNPAAVITPVGGHLTSGLQLQGNILPAEGHNIVAGVDVWQRILESKREKKVNQPVLDSLGNVVGTNQIIRGEIPIPRSDFNNFGVFAQDDIDLINEKLTFTIGGRVDFITVNNEMGIDPSYLVVNGKRNDNPPNQRIIFEKNRANNISWSATAGLLYHLTSQLDMTLSLARAFRAPSLEERFKYIDLGASVELGNPNLKPEDGYFTDLGIRLWNPRFTLKGNVYMNALSNLITGEPGTFVYSYTGDETQQDSLPAIVYGNIDKAMLYGFDLQFDYNFWSNIVLYGSASYVRGIDTKNNADLPLIPPLNGRAGIRYNLPGVAGIDFSAVLFADQNKVAQGETTTPGYAVYDMSVHSAQLNLNVANLQFFAGIENIFDRAYRYHLSTNRGQVQLEPGRNFYVKMNVRF